jgi:general secretion pathway protein A
MFPQFYGFTHTPFTRDIPPQDLFAADGQKELLARLTFLVKERGIGLVTGEIGSGKSTAVRRFVSTLDFNQYLVIYLLANPTIGMSGLYRDLLTALGYEPPYTRPRMVALIRSALTDLLQNKHRCPVIIIDEAHHLPPEAFEELRLLLSAEMDSRSLGALLLVGHPEMRATLRLSIHQSFSQRLSTRYHLGPLDLASTLGYIRHHLLISGYKGQTLFTDEAMQRIFEYTKGIPRQINRVCTLALMSGLIDQKSTLDESTLRKVIADIEQND